MNDELTVAPPKEDDAVEVTTVKEETVTEDDDGIADISEEQESASADATAELEALRKEVEQLKAELERKTEEAERVAAQISDFYSLFPETDISDIPQSVWESVKEGNSLAAAYALYHRRIQLKDEEVRRINEKNASLSPGRAGRGAASEYFTPDEVRAMSQKEVRANLTKIRESMKKWN